MLFAASNIPKRKRAKTQMPNQSEQTFHIGANQLAAMPPKFLPEQQQKMNAPRRNEKVANGALARRIKQVMHGRKTRAESRLRKAKDSKIPDITIIATGRSPVVIEAKYMHVPENEVQDQARKHVSTKVPKEAHPRL